MTRRTDLGGEAVIRMHLIRTLTSLCLVLAAAAPAAAQGSSPGQAAFIGGMDRQVRPGENFFVYANGGWLRETTIPPDRGAYGVGPMLAEQVDRRVVDLIQSAAAAGDPAGSIPRMVGDYYASFMDTTAIEAAGLTPLRPLLDTIAAIRTRTDLSRVLGSTLRADVDALNYTTFHTGNILGLWVAADLDEPTRYAPFLLQGGLGLPDRRYYLDTAAAVAGLRVKYQEHIAAMLRLAQVDRAGERAAAIMALETQIAQAHWSRRESGDVARANNRWRRADLAVKAPGVDWDAFLAAALLGQVPEFMVWQPSAITGIAALVGSAPLEDWKSYLTFHALQARAAVLPRAVGDQDFAFFGTAMGGVEQQRPRWRRGVRFTNEALGFAVGRMYADRYFPAASKAQLQEIVANMIAAFGARIDRLTWMHPATKEAARAKLATLKIGVGYPDTWPDYSGLEARPNDAFGNAERAALHYYRARLALIGQPVDPHEWVVTPQTIEAINLPVLNALNFPAAILQPPLFDPDRPAAMNYGAIGAAIGHEMSHSFDTQGAQFDAEGRWRNWWRPEDLEHFKAAAQRLVAQYDAYRPFPDLAINGEQTLDENIGDVAGLAIALDAYHLSLRGREAPAVGGFNGDQLLFIAFGQLWRQKIREQVLRQEVMSDGHAPNEYRAFTVRNLDAWYQAFGVKPGERLYLAPGERTTVW